MNSLLPINKPVGMSTYDLIRLFKTHNPDFKKKIKIGHAGTLDPFASGLVILLLGKATKTFAQFQKLPKTYLATATLGVSTPTLDSESKPTLQKNPPQPSKKEIEDAINSFPHEYEQSIPAFSAAKHQGKPLYHYARTGNMTIKKSKPVKIHSLKLTSYKFPQASFTSQVSSGTYIRQLSVDIFKKLKVDSFLSALKRTNIGPFSLNDAATLDHVYNKNWEEFLINPDKITNGSPN